MLERIPRSLLVTALIICCLALPTACKTKPPAEPVRTSPPTIPPPQKAEPVDEMEDFKEPEPRAEPVRETPSSLAARLNAEGIVARIHFDFDKSDLREDARRTLIRNAAAINKREYSQLKIRIEGHCDERGTVEYNLALGERRARAARDFLIAQGVPASRLSIISYGKERPLERGHNESAWAKNRRAEFVWRAD